MKLKSSSKIIRTYKCLLLLLALCAFEMLSNDFISSEVKLCRKLELSL